jgi:prevent-host-death family protein
MRTVNIRAAKVHLSRLVDEVASGEEIVIAKAGKPCARIVPFASDREPSSTRVPRTPGLMKGKLWIAEDFRRALGGLVHGSPRTAVTGLPHVWSDGVRIVHA